MPEDEAGREEARLPKAAKEKNKLLEEAKNALSDAFKALSAEALKSNTALTQLNLGGNNIGHDWPRQSRPTPPSHS